MSETTRREFLKTSGTLLGAAALGSAAPQMVFGHADPSGPSVPTLIAVYLRGGADPLQAIVPYGDREYYELRPTIGIQPVDGKDGKGVLRINDYFGLHPAMSPLMDMFKQGMVAPIVNVGSPHDTRSHFDAQDFMERAAPGVKSVNEGWLNRYLGMTGKGKDSELRALAFQMLLPRSLRGQYPVLAVPDNDAEYLLNTFERMYNCDEDQLRQQQVALTKNGQPLKPGARKQANGTPERPLITSADANKTIVMAGANEVKRLRELKAVVAEGERGEGYPESRFGRQMRDIATVIKSNRGLEVAAIDYDGWDHHAYQGGAEGTMANMLGDVSRVIKTFSTDLGADRMKKTLILVMSEFGRTAKENGSHGTDHGHGGFMLAVGGMVKGKKEVYGGWQGLAPENLNEKRDMPVTTDFRLVFAEALEMVFGFDTMKSRIFPDWTPKGRALGFLDRVQA